MTQFYPKKDENEVLLSGVVKEDLELVDIFKGTSVFSTSLGVLRLSGREDVLPIFISNRLDCFDKVIKGAYIKVKGVMRSAQYRDENRKKRTRVYVHVKEVTILDKPSNDNNVVLEGRLFRKPIFRASKTEENVVLSELIVEVHRGYNKYEHIPVIVWENDAKYISSFDKGRRVRIEGRFQSRYFLRNKEDGIESSISYEVSARSIEVLQ